jgi:hypothetical protein
MNSNFSLIHKQSVANISGVSEITPENAHWIGTKRHYQVISQYVVEVAMIQAQKLDFVMTNIMSIPEV